MLTGGDDAGKKENKAAVVEQQNKPVEVASLTTDAEDQKDLSNTIKVEE